LLSDNDFSGYFGRSFWPAPSPDRRFAGAIRIGQGMTDPEIRPRLLDGRLLQMSRCSSSSLQPGNVVIAPTPAWRQLVVATYPDAMAVYRREAFSGGTVRCR
jgi:hypothetical protein